MRATLISTILLTGALLAAPPPPVSQAAAPSQSHATLAAPAQLAPSPGDVARSFYEWYLGELNKGNTEPLKNSAEALKYMTPEFHKKAPRLTREYNADIFICAHDRDANWAKNFTVGRADIRGTKATVVVRLPAGNGLAIKVKTTLVKRLAKMRGGEWRIGASECVN